MITREPNEPRYMDELKTYLNINLNNNKKSVEKKNQLKSN